MSDPDRPSQPQAPPPGGSPVSPSQPPPGYAPPGYAPPGVPPWAGSYGIPPRYQRDGERKKKKSTFWPVLLVVFGLVAVVFIVMTLLGNFVLGRRGQGGGSSPLAFGHRIGLLRIEGPIFQGDDFQFWLKSLQEFGRNDRIKGIILRIDSPGGTVGGSQELQAEVARIRRERAIPVYVSMGDVAASGGYYIAAAADRIFALKGTLTGSIGVIFSKPEISELSEKIGYRTEIVKSGRFKDAGSITRKMGDDERYMFDYLIQNTYHQFLDDILAYRSAQLLSAGENLSDQLWDEFRFLRPEILTPHSFLTQVADGRVYTGEQALTLGLVDEIGSLQTAISAMAEKLQISGEPEILEPARKVSLAELLSAKADSLLPETHSTLKYLMVLP